MKRYITMGVSIAVLLFLAGCQSLAGGNAGLEREIAQIETRVSNLESDIVQSTPDISASTAALRTKMKYRPLASWAERFSAMPSANRTLRFQQTRKRRSIHRRRERCRLTGRERDTENAFIHENDSTRAALVLKNFTVTSRNDGLILTGRLDFDGRTQVAGTARNKCFGGWSPTVSIGVPVQADETVKFKLTLSQAEQGSLRYNMDNIAPETIGARLSTRVAGFNLRTTMRIKGMLGRLVSGEVPLLFGNTGEIMLPNGEPVPYRISTTNPQFSSDMTGVELVSDVEIIVGDSAVGR
ncbi:hypothetical protein [Sphingorhabdus sp. Alg239-R122]|uniref:hypothetical protein n=1 Tax=Sphingorhabdus sp. Alg239-R122 TaxID=2305989 RepID=UPI0013DD68A0|nr:hypothetical protein [Sphingorhabdus sp. Alg239-R122]